MVIGCDNGLDGGLCAIAAFDGSVIGSCAMPTLQRGRKREIDVRAVADWCAAWGTPFVFVPEEPLHFAPTLASMRSMALSFGQLLALAALRGWPCVPTEPGPWQGAMLGRFPKGQSKVYALAKARVLAPGETWLATPRSTTPHSGIVDAFLIARWWLAQPKSKKELAHC
jgi:hypothetical protein